MECESQNNAPSHKDTPVLIPEPVMMLDYLAKGS